MPITADGGYIYLHHLVLWILIIRIMFPFNVSTHILHSWILFVKNTFLLVKLFLKISQNTQFCRYVASEISDSFNVNATHIYLNFIWIPFTRAYKIYSSCRHPRRNINNYYILFINRNNWISSEFISHSHSIEYFRSSFCVIILLSNEKMHSSTKFESIA